MKITQLIPYSVSRKLIKIGRQIVLPGFQKLPLYDVLVFFVRALLNGTISTRASAMAFSFFLALFPAIIFLFSVIAFLPIKNLEILLLDYLKFGLPNEAFELSKSTILDLALNQRGSLLSFGFLSMIVFASNGVNTMIDMFNQSVLTTEKRPFFKQWFIAITLMFVLFLLLIISTGLIVFWQWLAENLLHISFFSSFAGFLIEIGKWMVVFCFIYFAISVIYFLAPATRNYWTFFSAGSTLSTLLIIIFSLGFAYYVNHFGQYNKLYGSIGTLIVIMLYIFFNSAVLLIGFELNAAIAGAKKRKLRV